MQETKIEGRLGSPQKKHKRIDSAPPKPLKCTVQDSTLCKGDARDMEIIISSNVDKPIYEQIVSQIKGQIMDGHLHPGDAIPSMRALAKTIHVSVLTVQKAYEQLQRDGFIEMTVGRGSFVSAGNRDFILEEQRRQVENHLQAAVDTARSSGIPLEDLQKLLNLLYAGE